MNEAVDWYNKISSKSAEDYDVSNKHDVLGPQIDNNRQKS